jgi:hypothetical protein
MDGRHLVDSLRSSVTAGAGLSTVFGQGGSTVGQGRFTRCSLDAPRRLVDVHVLRPLGQMRDGISAPVLEHRSLNSVPMVSDMTGTLSRCQRVAQPHEVDGPSKKGSPHNRR